MKISVITISYNQVEFLERTILSVLRQDYKNFEYIIVDPGSTDGSRNLINQYKDYFSQIIFEPDAGPADGLNKGFNLAQGDVFYFINSDDTLLPKAFSRAINVFKNNPNIDIVLGNGYIIDEKDTIRKNKYVDNFELKKSAYGIDTFLQQSFFFTKKAFLLAGGFNTPNKTCWDFELLIDMGIQKCRVKRTNHFLANFRIHNASVSGSGRLTEQYKEDLRRIFYKVHHREQNSFDTILKIGYRLSNLIYNPMKIFARLHWNVAFNKKIETI
jgi:glycosyltransferase involved in cell wall biosynthesis